MSDEATRPEAVPLSGSAEDVQARRVRALRASDEADAKAVDVELQSQIYSKAADELKNQAFKAEAEARGLEAKGDAEKSAELRAKCKELRDLAERNYKLADEKGRLVMTLRREAYQQKSLAVTLALELRGETPHVAGQD